MGWLLLLLCFVATAVAVDSCSTAALNGTMFLSSATVLNDDYGGAVTVVYVQCCRCCASLAALVTAWWRLLQSQCARRLEVFCNMQQYLVDVRRQLCVGE
jgi:hypothetical protein